MLLTNLTKSIVFALLLSFTASAQIFVDPISKEKEYSTETGQRRATYPVRSNERLFIQALRTLYGAQMTYQATTGNGNYGTMSELAQAGLIDRDLATGRVSGYNFFVSARDQSPPAPATFEIGGFPELYGKTGIRSFFMETDGVIRGADKRGAHANRNDPVIEEEYTCDSPAACEESAISSLRLLHAAQMTYQATSGAGNYGSLCQLAENNLIPQILAEGSRFGYYFMVSKRDRAEGQKSAGLEIRAVPRNYPATGVRSFFIGIEGVLQGADRAGAPVNSDAPVINY